MAKTIIVMDGKGRICVPKRLRKELGFAPGNEFMLETMGDCVKIVPADKPQGQRIMFSVTRFA